MSCNGQMPTGAKASTYAAPPKNAHKKSAQEGQRVITLCKAGLSVCVIESINRLHLHPATLHAPCALPAKHQPVSDRRAVLQNWYVR